MDGLWEGMGDGWSVGWMGWSNRIGDSVGGSG